MKPTRAENGEDRKTRTHESHAGRKAEVDILCLLLFPIVQRLRVGGQSKLDVFRIPSRIYA